MWMWIHFYALVCIGEHLLWLFLEWLTWPFTVFFFASCYTRCPGGSRLGCFTVCMYSMYALQMAEGNGWRKSTVCECLFIIFASVRPSHAIPRHISQTATQITAFSCVHCNAKEIGPKYFIILHVFCDSSFVWIFFTFCEFIISDPTPGLQLHIFWQERVRDSQGSHIVIRPCLCVIICFVYNHLILILLLALLYHITWTEWLCCSLSNCICVCAPKSLLYSEYSIFNCESLSIHPSYNHNSESHEHENV